MTFTDCKVEKRADGDEVVFTGAGRPVSLLQPVLNVLAEDSGHFRFAELRTNHAEITLILNEGSRAAIHPASGFQEFVLQVGDGLCCLRPASIVDKKLHGLRQRAIERLEALPASQCLEP